jgi:multidrug efflux pump subunit AcrA (membrane-fusion protein)
MILALEDARRHFGEKEWAYAGHDDKKVAHRVKRRPTAALWLLFLLVPVSAGCQSQTPPAAEPMLAVPISHPVQRAVTDYVDFTGRTDAVQSLNVVARVTGYLVRLPFQEGAEVKKGDLLFEIEPEPYEAQVRLGEAEVASNQAQVVFAELNYQRAVKLNEEKAVSQQEIDQDKATRDQAVAQLDAAQANLNIYRLNLQYTHVTSPIDGQVSRYFLTLGNLVNQDQTLLTTVVSLDPIYAYFDVDQRNLVRIRTAIDEGRLRSRRAAATAASAGRDAPYDKVLAAQGTTGLTGATTVLPSAIAALGLAALPVAAEAPQFPVLLGMPGDNKYPYQGFINFSNNQLNPNTGSISVRGVFANPKPPNGVRLLSPGMFVRIRLPIGPPHPALLVIDRAIQSDQGQSYMYVVNSENKTEYRQIVTGALQEDGLRVVSSGLKADDRVVVGAIQQLRPNTEVKTQETAMPSFGAMPSGSTAMGR